IAVDTSQPKLAGTHHQRAVPDDQMPESYTATRRSRASNHRTRRLGPRACGSRAKDERTKEMTRNSLRRHLWLGAVVPAVALFAAACSSTSSTSSAAAGSAASAPSGAPVTVGVIYTATSQN